MTTDERRRAAVPIIAVSLVWGLVELIGVVSRQTGDTFTEVYRSGMRISPLVSWGLGGFVVAVSIWLPPHMIANFGWPWLIWAIVVCVVIALATYGLLDTGILVMPHS